MGMILYALLVTAILTTSAPAAGQAEQLAGQTDEPTVDRYQSARILMGVQFNVSLYARSQAAANHAFEAAFSRIDQLNDRLSDYDPQSELSKINQTAGSGKLVSASNDLWTVVNQAQSLSRRTAGAFDITVGPLTKLWRRARRRQQMIPEERLTAARDAVGYQHIKLNSKNQTIELTRPGMRLDLGGIAKGYAADEALVALKKLGITRAIVNGSGDLAVGDPPPGKCGWKIGIAPRGAKEPPSKFLVLSHCGIATSGDAWQFVEIAGRRYSHIVDPATGLGLTNQIGVTVVASNCTAADSLASAISVLGPKRGLRLIEETPGAEAFLQQIDGDKLKTFQSTSFCKLPAATE